LIDDLRDATWQRYNIQLIDEFRDQLKTNLANYSEKEPDDPGLVIRKEDSTKNGGPRAASVISTISLPRRPNAGRDSR
jgi:hypothetical protein